MDDSVKNPRTKIRFIDQNGHSWIFNFIHYNNKKWGGTRNEFRLTGITPFLRQNSIYSGDEIEFSQDSHNQYHIRFSKFEATNENNNIQVKLKLSHNWRVVPLK